VHGVVHDTIEFVNGIISVELNSATDNPVSFSAKVVCRMHKEVFLASLMKRVY